MENKINKHYPTALRKEFESQINKDQLAFLKFRMLTDSNIAEYRVNDFDYFFTIKNIKGGNNSEVYITFSFFPKNDMEYETADISQGIKGTVDYFKRWLNVVTESLNYKSPFDYEQFYQNYDQEFYNFNNYRVDQDLNLPLSLESHEWAIKFLGEVEEKIDHYLLEKQNPEIARIKEDIKTVKENIGGLTKKQVFKLFTRYLSVIRTHSTSLFTEISKQYSINKILELIDKGMSAIAELLP